MYEENPKAEKRKTARDSQESNGYLSFCAPKHVALIIPFLSCPLCLGHAPFYLLIMHLFLMEKQNPFTFCGS